MNQWTWMGGSKGVCQIGSYGTLGESNASNIPGARCGAIAWTDGSGVFWLFGGMGFVTTGQNGYLNDLWKYDPESGEWTWVKGTREYNPPGVFGTQGEPDTDNTPGGKIGAASWIDDSGNMWLFGGFGKDTFGGWGEFNDLWMYNPCTNEWTWMKGSNGTVILGVYGTKGVPANANTPGSRASAMAWKGFDGNLWLYGGSGVAEQYGGGLGDMWKYDLCTNQWTWMQGSKSANTDPNYGTQGVSNLENTPGRRINAVSWTDDSGLLWMFGGVRYNGSYEGSLNDLWVYGLPESTPTPTETPLPECTPLPTDTPECTPTESPETTPSATPIAESTGWWDSYDIAYYNCSGIPSEFALDVTVSPTDNAGLKITPKKGIDSIPVIPAIVSDGPLSKVFIDGVARNMEVNGSLDALVVKNGWISELASSGFGCITMSNSSSVDASTILTSTGSNEKPARITLSGIALAGLSAENQSVNIRMSSRKVRTADGDVFLLSNLTGNVKAGDSLFIQVTGGDILGNLTARGEVKSVIARPMATKTDGIVHTVGGTIGSSSSWESIAGGGDAWLTEHPDYAGKGKPVVGALSGTNGVFAIIAAGYEETVVDPVTAPTFASGLKRVGCAKNAQIVGEAYISPEAKPPVLKGDSDALGNTFFVHTSEE
jgi:hypothetical protein